VLGAIAVLGGGALPGGLRSRQSGCTRGGAPGDVVLGATAVLGGAVPGAVPGAADGMRLPGGPQPGGRRSRCTSDGWPAGGGEPGVTVALGAGPREGAAPGVQGDGRPGAVPGEGVTVLGAIAVLGVVADGGVPAGGRPANPSRGR
jgi:hypothetical protein